MTVRPRLGWSQKSVRDLADAEARLHGLQQVGRSVREGTAEGSGESVVRAASLCVADTDEVVAHAALELVLAAAAELHGGEDALRLAPPVRALYGKAMSWGETTTTSGRQAAAAAAQRSAVELAREAGLVGELASMLTTDFDGGKGPAVRHRPARNLLKT